ncbi:unnamed protein product [Agarophyton chilense]
MTERSAFFAEDPSNTVWFDCLECIYSSFPTAEKSGRDPFDRDFHGSQNSLDPLERRHDYICGKSMNLIIEYISIPVLAIVAEFCINVAGNNGIESYVFYFID